MKTMLIGILILIWVAIYFILPEVFISVSISLTLIAIWLLCLAVKANRQPAWKYINKEKKGESTNTEENREKFWSLNLFTNLFKRPFMPPIDRLAFLIVCLQISIVAFNELSEKRLIAGDKAVVNRSPVKTQLTDFQTKIPPDYPEENNFSSYGNGEKVYVYNEKYDVEFEVAAREEKWWNPDIMRSICAVESYGCTDPDAESDEGAKGLLQLMDETIDDNCQGIDPFNPVHSIHCGTRYFKKLMKKYGDVRLALAAYNCCSEKSIDERLDEAENLAGERSYEAIYPDLPDETKKYVRDVLEVYKTFGNNELVNNDSEPSVH